MIARPSVMQYLDNLPPVPEIVETLNVETIMAGSVRYANDRVLISAQLIDGRTGGNLWAEEFDRELLDVFAVWAEIAENIATALQAELLPSERESIETAPTNSPEALAAHLRAMALLGESYGGENAAVRQIAQTYLDEAIELDPVFALAHAWKALLYEFSRMSDPVTEQEWPQFKLEMNRLVEEHANIALEIDPNMALPHAVLSLMYFNNWQGDLAQQERNRALELDPNDPVVLGATGGIGAYLEREEINDTIAFAERAIDLDPNSTTTRVNLAVWNHFSGRYTEAIEAA